MDNKIISIGDVLKQIRNTTNLSQSEFAKNIKKSRDWYTLKELDKSKIYMNDLITILKYYSFNIKLISKNNGVKLSLTDFEPSAILRFMRESTGETQIKFANSIGKKRTWQSGNEAGDTNYYANDLIELAKKHNFEIKLIKN